MSYDIPMKWGRSGMSLCKGFTEYHFAFVFESFTRNVAELESLGFLHILLLLWWTFNLKFLDSVARIQLDLRWVKRLKSVVSLIQLVGGLLAGFLTLTALLVIGNTIRLELLRRRSEMEVANLLGATNSFMNRPILYTGALYGFLGGIVSCLVAVLAFSAIQKPAHELSSLYESSFRLLMPNISQILIVLGVSIVLGFIGALGSLYRPSQQLTYGVPNTW